MATRHVVGDDPARWGNEFERGELAVFVMLDTGGWWYLDVDGVFERWTGGIEPLGFMGNGCTCGQTVCNNSALPVGRMTP